MSVAFETIGGVIIVAELAVLAVFAMAAYGG